MNLDGIDFQLFKTFEAVLRTRSVTAAAESLGLSQPTMSYGLNKLRALLHDPLFVRIGNEMRPTPRAQAVAVPIRLILETLEKEVLDTRTFDPATSDREIRFCMADIGEMYFLPRILRFADTVAPNMTFRVLSLTPDRLEAALANGDVDLAMGYFPDLSKDNFFQQQLGTSSFVCIARAGNPHVGKRLTAKRYFDAPHIAAHTALRSMEVFDRSLLASGAEQPRVKLRVPHFIALLGIVAQSDLIATVPLEAAHAVTHASNIRVHRLPFPSPVFALRQHWHRRYHHDPVNKWLRESMQGLFHDLLSERGLPSY
ncbi:LysR family transcriptional regulator [Pigmentiphaga litoralis]|uniref:DNA-binding transcriptional LysR family regulator n=1 Tax=Pigmentiphaga litoralis TaxID=516702 RepID=A0A7Y9LJU8_9BURK|nr:LysR family transcriptional regulator [Pigmentiphaga litoralis]NYE25551.1 DNA-binding transcriptional LysR family regulator [Pigmentiphaga litoralis]NYE80837.1 DNA-binding transcriptional LysR family regulator [Pigmentiphaga litoralis]